MAPLMYEGPKQSRPSAPAPRPTPSPSPGLGGGNFSGSGGSSGSNMRDALAVALQNAVAAQQAQAAAGADSYYTARVPAWGTPGYVAGAYNGASQQTVMGNALNSFWTDQDAQRRIVAAASAAYGYSVNLPTARAFWQDLLQESQISGRPAWNIINNINNGTIDLNSTSGGGGGGGYGGGGGGGGSTTTQVQLTNPETAKGLVNNAMANLLGRQATEKELKQFLTALNEAERDNPIVSTVTATGSGSSVEVSGGTNPTQIAQEYAESRPEYAEFQAATTYLDAFIAALDDPVEL